MQKQGFTLIELLAIIIILGILITITIPNVSKTTKEFKDKSYSLLIESLENGAQIYVSRNRSFIQEKINQEGVYIVRLSDLKELNLIKDNLRDPRTNKVISLNKKIYVMYDLDLSLIYCFEDRDCPTPFIP
ncbi:MAG: prepilin-type N-terminal cleavage/methylation domain-containing protein [Bacilli bacterium]|jgi:prepilin-type N-terminal cleavage/methylation domain-containing protein